MRRIYILFIICVLILGLVIGSIWIEKNAIIWGNWLFYLIGFLLYMLCSYCFSKYYFYKVRYPKKKIYIRLKRLFKVTIIRIQSVLCLIFSPNYFFVDENKNRIPKRFLNAISNVEKPTIRNKYITKLNYMNLIFSFIILLIGVFVKAINNHFSLTIFIGFIVYRAISRSVEIIFAFGKDAITKENKSNLEKFDRIKLAINSYFEVLINFTSTYFLLFYDSYKKIVDAFFLSFGINTLTYVNYDKICVNNQFLNILLINKFLIALHVLTILTLVVLALAMYVSDVKKRD